MATEALLAHVLVAKYADFRVSRTHRSDGGVELCER
jgi:hypothetical protein